jgi:hypothetical protein
MDSPTGEIKGVEYREEFVAVDDADGKPGGTQAKQKSIGNIARHCIVCMKRRNLKHGN